LYLGCAAKCNSFFTASNGKCPFGTKVNRNAANIFCKGITCNLNDDAARCCVDQFCSARVYSADGSLCQLIKLNDTWSRFFSAPQFLIGSVGLQITKGKLVRDNVALPRECFVVSFQYKPFSVSNSETSIFRIAKRNSTQDCCSYNRGDRLFAIFLKQGTTNLRISVGREGDSNNVVEGPLPSLPLNRFTKVSIEVSLSYIAVYYDNILRLTRKYPAHAQFALDHTNLLLYAGDKFYNAANGIIKSLEITENCKIHTSRWINLKPECRHKAATIRFSQKDPSLIAFDNYISNHCRIIVALGRRGTGTKSIVAGDVKACSTAGIGCDKIRSVKIEGEGCIAMIYTNSGNRCDDVKCDFTKPEGQRGICCNRGDGSTGDGFCKVLYSNTAWQDMTGCGDHSDFIRLYSESSCTLQTSTKLKGGEIVKQQTLSIQRKEALTHGKVTFCDDPSGQGRCCSLGKGKQGTKVTKGSCPGDNKISYIDVPVGCTATVCVDKCNYQTGGNTYLLTPGIHKPPTFPDNSISRANICVS
jgi:hypothetical protein